ncbi:hypothetical protein [Nocardiopsis sp. YSL2]|uniref:hypothetical protein n=1 Tax=Nocardiopsis sp. YSL2 TaxID=2939492 RepID=UPI0026F43025|nr:hypothetical protein [Nocardiopsis sp. YSL2]
MNAQLISGTGFCPWPETVLVLSELRSSFSTQPILLCMKGPSMEFHVPGRPEDLPSFDTLWARAATLAVLEAGGGENQQPSNPESSTSSHSKHERTPAGCATEPQLKASYG